MRIQVLIFLIISSFLNISFAQTKCTRLFDQLPVQNVVLKKSPIDIVDVEFKNFFKVAKEDWGNKRLLQEILNHPNGKRFLSDAHLPSSKPNSLFQIIKSFGNYFSIRNYTRDGFQSMNEALRAGLSIDDKQCVKCRSFFNSLRRLPSFKGYVFRTVHDVDSFKNEFQFLRQEGQVYVDPGFISTSRDIDGTMPIDNSGAVLVIKSRTGKSIEAIGIKCEKEVTFLPGTKFQVEIVTEAFEGLPLILISEVE